MRSAIRQFAASGRRAKFALNRTPQTAFLPAGKERLSLFGCGQCFHSLFCLLANLVNLLVLLLRRERRVRAHIRHLRTSLAIDGRMPLQRAFRDAGLLPAGNLSAAAIRLRLLWLMRLLRFLRLVRLLRLIGRLRDQQRGAERRAKQDGTNDENKFLNESIWQHHVISI